MPPFVAAGIQRAWIERRPVGSRWWDRSIRHLWPADRAGYGGRKGRRSRAEADVLVRLELLVVTTQPSPGIRIIGNDLCYGKGWVCYRELAARVAHLYEIGRTRPVGVGLRRKVRERARGATYILSGNKRCTEVARRVVLGKLSFGDAAPSSEGVAPVSRVYLNR